MKKVALFAVVGLVLWAGVIYGGGKYADVKPFIEKMAVSLEKFITDMEKAENADDVVAELDALTEVMKKLAPKMREIVKKYPELKDERTHPEELKPLLKNMDELGKKLFGVMGKIQQFANEPHVKEANKRFMEAMAALDPDTEKPKEEK
jgi:soluble cytochrome b562